MHFRDLPKGSESVIGEPQYQHIGGLYYREKGRGKRERYQVSGKLYIF